MSRQRAETLSGPLRDTEDRDRLLGVHQAADLLGIKVSTLYQWNYERRIPVVKLFGRALRFRLSAIQKLIADSERPALTPDKQDENKTRGRGDKT